MACAACAAQVEVSVVDADGVASRASDFVVDVKRSAEGDGGETAVCRVT